MKINKYLLFLIIIFLTEFAQAEKAIEGLRTLSSYVMTAGMILGPLAFMVAGLVFMADKQRGLEKASGVVIGALIFGGASSLFSLIYKAVN